MIAKLLERHIEAVRFSIEAVRKVRRIGRATTRAPIARAYYSAPHDRLREFGAILTGEAFGTEGTKPIALLWKYLVACPVGGASAEKLMYSKTERALKAFLSGEKLNKLYVSTDELFPLPEEVKK